MPGAQVTRELWRVPPVRLDPIARPFRDERRRGDEAIDPRRSQPSMELIPSGPSLVRAPQELRRTQPLQLSIESHPAARNSPDRLRCSSPDGLRDRDLVLVDVQTDVAHLLLMDWPPLVPLQFARSSTICGM